MPAMFSERTVMEGLEGRWTQMEKPGLRWTGGPQACSRPARTQHRALPERERLLPASAAPSPVRASSPLHSALGSVPTRLQKDPGVGVGGRVT